MREWLLVGKMNASGESCSKLIDPVPFRVGRRPEAALTLPRATISGMHAELFAISAALTGRSLMVNGLRVSPS
jgi:hypothetical protein